MMISKHAQSRMTSRGIYPIHIELLDRFGKIVLHQGREVIWFDKKSRRQLKAHMGPKLLKEILSINVPYIVTEANVLVTAARKKIRFKSRKY